MRRFTILAAVALTIGLTIGAHAETAAHASVDVLAIAEGAQADGGVLAHLKRNWGKYVVGVVSAVIVDRVALNNDWLWYSGGSERGDSVNVPPGSTVVLVSRNTAPVTVRLNSDNVMAEE